jgi:hypothetical protein
MAVVHAGASERSWIGRSHFSQRVPKSTVDPELACLPSETSKFLAPRDLTDAQSAVLGSLTRRSDAEADPPARRRPRRGGLHQPRQRSSRRDTCGPRRPRHRRPFEPFEVDAGLVTGRPPLRLASETDPGAARRSRPSNSDVVTRRSMLGSSGCVGDLGGDDAAWAVTDADTEPWEPGESPVFGLGRAVGQRQDVVEISQSMCSDDDRAATGSAPTSGRRLREQVERVCVARSERGPPEVPTPLARLTDGCPARLCECCRRDRGGTVACSAGTGLVEHGDLRKRIF